MSCAAYRVNDVMRCACGLSWDIEDPAPPYCKAADNDPTLGPDGPAPRAVLELHVDGRKPKGKRFRVAAQGVDEIPAETMLAMAVEYERALSEHRAMPMEARRIKAMRCAFALFLKA